MKYFERKVTEKVRKKNVKVGDMKMKIKTNFVLFSTACSILEPMLCNRNLTKLVYPTLLKRTINQCKIPFIGKNTFFL